MANGKRTIVQGKRPVPVMGGGGVRVLVPKPQLKTPFDKSAPGINPIFTGTMSGSGPQYVTLHTRTYANTGNKAQTVLVLARFGNAWKQNGTVVVERMTSVLLVDGTAVTPGVQEQFMDGGQLGMRAHAVVVEPGKSITVTMQVCVVLLSGSATFAFSGQELLMLALGQE